MWHGGVWVPDMSLIQPLYVVGIHDVFLLRDEEKSEIFEKVMLSSILA
jgi:hypothetical protein